MARSDDLLPRVPSLRPWGHSRSKFPEKVSWWPKSQNRRLLRGVPYLLTLLNRGSGRIVVVDSFLGGSLTLLCGLGGIVGVNSLKRLAGWPKSQNRRLFREVPYLLTLLYRGSGRIVVVDSFLGGSLTLLSCLGRIVVVDTWSEVRLLFHFVHCRYRTLDLPSSGSRFSAALGA
jgi:hypothetical protein